MALAFFTSGESYCARSDLFAAWMVFVGLVIICRLARCPTSLLPVSSKATTEGVVRYPPLFGITLAGRPPPPPRRNRWCPSLCRSLSHPASPSYFFRAFNSFAALLCLGSNSRVFSNWISPAASGPAPHKPGPAKNENPVAPFSCQWPSESKPGTARNCADAPTPAWPSGTANPAGPDQASAPRRTI